MEFRNQLELEFRRWIAIYGDGETPFAVYVAGDVAIQPFLLIVRTLRIVTVACPLLTKQCFLTACTVVRDARIFQHLARFIDSNFPYCLTTF
jgi:hypothetical protein